MQLWPSILKLATRIGWKFACGSSSRYITIVSSYAKRCPWKTPGRWTAGRWTDRRALIPSVCFKEILPIFFKKTSPFSNFELKFWEKIPWVILNKFLSQNSDEKFFAPFSTPVNAQLCVISPDYQEFSVFSITMLTFFYCFLQACYHVMWVQY